MQIIRQCSLNGARTALIIKVSNGAKINIKSKIKKFTHMVIHEITLMFLHRVS